MQTIVFAQTDLDLAVVEFFLAFQVQHGQVRSFVGSRHASLLYLVQHVALLRKFLNKTIHHILRFDFILVSILSHNVEIKVGPRYIELGMVGTCDVDG